MRRRTRVPSPALAPALAFALSLATSSIVASQTPAPPQPATAPANPWTEMSVKSAALGEDRRLFIVPPVGYSPTGTRKFPALVLLDADDAAQFNAAITTVRFLGSRGAIPQLIIVGVANGKDRTRDMTPPPDAKTAKISPTGGGSQRLLDFITTEALPAVRAQYRVADYTVLAGHSFGGLFGAWVAATHPGTFPAIIAMSPSLWWNDSTVAKAYADGIAKANVPLRLFVGNGGQEPPIDHPTARFNKDLESSKPSRLAFNHARYPDASHGLVPISALLDGLQFIFRPISVAVTALNGVDEQSADSATIMKAAAATERQYRTGLDAFPKGALALSDTLPETVLRDYGGYLLTLPKQAPAAKATLARVAELYPRSPRAHFDLARAHLAVVDTVSARRELAVADSLAAPTGALKRSIGELAGKLQVVQAGAPRPPL
jgi:predicted alpha/beta superfamily hydrolase